MMADIDLDELYDELAEFAPPSKKEGLSPREERIIARFEEIQRFFQQHGYAPRHGEDRDIFERLYAIRLGRLRALEECQTLLADHDHDGLLSGDMADRSDAPASMDDDALLAELKGVTEGEDITRLRHVRSKAEINTAEEIANREKCKDFDRFAPLFEKAERELKLGVRKALPFGGEASIEKGNFFILGGQTAYVAEVGESFRAPNGENDARLRVIYANGTESNLLRRSLQRALYKDKAGRRLSEIDHGPLFSRDWEEDDIESGTIYVLRSLSNEPFIAEHRELIHKIGVTGGKVETRIANAAHEASYLLADVEVVATYKLSGINRTKLENLFHRIFSSARLDLSIKDRFGHLVQPMEWFLVPLAMIDEAVGRIRDGTITKFRYDPEQVRLVEK
uniref:T5orf172 domain-containing protein n=1 Tax=Candidatus Kentrum sp. TUN TaxID=2126343 RepID=A0A450ZP13_9GAMM|nr:MAG: T5orf172 domain-containing protein [Candidatus Kentron sp. TUN]VFK61476.1 MAG: T5orf172 domain-containing protein [Candidatus Kentron sp. TUN]